MQLIRYGADTVGRADKVTYTGRVRAVKTRRPS